MDSKMLSSRLRPNRPLLRPLLRPSRPLSRPSRPPRDNKMDNSKASRLLRHSNRLARPGPTNNNKDNKLHQPLHHPLHRRRRSKGNSGWHTDEGDLGKVLVLYSDTLEAVTIFKQQQTLTPLGRQERCGRKRNVENVL